MKFFTLSFFTLLISLHSFCQRAVIDSLNIALQNQKEDTDKAFTLCLLSYQFEVFKPDSALLLAERAYSISKKNKYLTGESLGLGRMAAAFNRLGNYPKALEYYLGQLKIEEKRNYPEQTASVYMNIALVYNNEHDADKALQYIYQANAIVKKNNLPELFLYTSLNTGDIYEKINNLDSALYYTLQCLRNSLKQKNDQITGTALNNLGNIYSKKGSLQQALNFYERSIPYLESMQDDNTLAECKLGLAKVFERTGLNDSAFYYANASFNLASKSEFLKHALNASTFLTALYKDENRLDSAFTYQGIMLTLKDSIDSREKIRQLQSLTIAEQLRQNEIAQMRLHESEDRRKKLQLLAIGIFIPICFFMSVYISRKKVHKKIIEFSGIVSLLLFFEYITLLLHPYISEKTNDSPFMEIVIFVGIAALITPSHHKIEEWLVSRLTKMHLLYKEARLNALKNATLEEKQDS